MTSPFKRTNESDLINSIVKEAGEDWLEKEVRNPATGRTVKVKSLPAKERAKYKPKTKQKPMSDAEVAKAVQDQMDRQHMETHLTDPPGREKIHNHLKEKGYQIHKNKDGTSSVQHPTSGNSYKLKHSYEGKYNIHDESGTKLPALPSLHGKDIHKSINDHEEYLNIYQQQHGNR